MGWAWRISVIHNPCACGPSRLLSTSLPSEMAGFGIECLISHLFFSSRELEVDALGQEEESIYDANPLLE